MKGDDMIRETYLRGKTTKQPKALTRNPLLQMFFLSIFFVISAQQHPYFGAQPVFLFVGLAVVMALPASVHHILRKLRTPFAARNGPPHKPVSMHGFVNSHPDTMSPEISILVKT